LHEQANPTRPHARDWRASVDYSRRKATACAIACTFIGKHLRFSTAGLKSIIASGATRPSHQHKQ
jgi:hypothetical protein